MEAGVKSLAEGLLFMQKVGSLAAGGLAGGLSRFGGTIGGAAGTATRMGVNAVNSGVSGVRNFIQDRQYTKELHNSELGVIARDFGIRMRRSNPNEIRMNFRDADAFVQDKGDGVIGIYDKCYNFMGIRDRDGSYRGAKFLSEEDRNKYGKFDIDQTYGAINTETGTFVQGRGENPVYNNNRIGRVENTNIIKNLNKTM